MRHRRAAVLCIAAILLPLGIVGGSAAASPGTPTLDITMGVDGGDLPALTGAPKAVDVGSDGNVFVAADTGITEMTSVGEHVEDWTYPVAVGVTDDGHDTWYV